MRVSLIRGCWAVAALAGLCGAAPALAGGATPYYGFSGYFGGPATYYTLDTDIHQTTRLDENGGEAFGTRVYTAGGPFWGYKARARTGGLRHYRHPRKVRVVRVKG